MPTDTDLLDAWRQGSAAAGKDLVGRHFGAVHRFFVNKVSNQADDLVQATFLRCVEQRDRFEGRSSFRTFVFAVARNVLFEHYRSTRRRDIEFGVTSMAALDPSPSQIVADVEWERALLETLRTVPAEVQLLLELYYWEGLSTTELAEVFSVARGTIKSRLSAARSALRDACAERGLEVGVGTRRVVPGWARDLGELSPPS
ncbi:MAG: sigma-70 family RNA polymerase sigma factor [Deltaproteobacteria bacterium]|nr:sigma-70 family RNA polymerase sigma factor [Deltaproteobacteria bacterium]